MAQAQAAPLPDEAAGRKGAGADALRFFFLSRAATTNVESTAAQLARSPVRGN